MFGRRVIQLLFLAGVVLAVRAPAQVVDARLAAKFKEAADAQRAGDLERAAASYAEVLRMQPNIPEVYVNFGLVRYQQKRFDDAVSLLEKATAMKPSLGAAYLFLGISHHSLNRTEPALRALEEAVRLAPNDPHALMWHGVALMAAGRISEAARQLDAAALYAPKDIDVLYHRGRAHLKLSQESYQQMFKLDPESARVHQVLAQSYEEAGKEADAVAEYEQAVRRAPNMPGINEALGSLYWKLADFDKAEAAFLRELDLDPHNVLAKYKLGSIRVERGKPEEGLPLLEAAVKQNPDEIDAYYYLGKAQNLLGQPEAALVSLRKVIDGKTAGPLVESAYYQLALVYRKLGRTDQAHAAIETFKKLKGERDREKAEKLDELKKRTSN